MSKVSVVMSIYNEEIDIIKLAIESILNQTFEDLEYIIILDNPEYEMAWELLKGYKNQDNRIMIIRNKKNIGLAKSMNKGIEISTGTYIARMDADDIAVKERIDKEVEYLVKNNYDMVSIRAYFIDENGKITGSMKDCPNEEKIRKALPIRNIILHPGVLIKKDVLMNVGMYRNYSTSQDYDLWLRLLSENYRIGVLNEKLLYFRSRSSSVSNRDRFKQFLNDEYIKKMYNERLKYGNDTYSEKSLSEYIIKNKYSDKKYKNKTNKYLLSFTKSFNLYREKKIGAFIMFLLKAIINSKEVRKRFYCMINYYKIIKFS